MLTIVGGGGLILLSVVNIDKNLLGFGVKILMEMYRYPKYVNS